MLRVEVIMTVARPLNELLDPERGSDFPVSLLPSEGVTRRTDHSSDKRVVHKRARTPLRRCRRRSCGRSVTALTGAVLKGSHDQPVHLVRRLRGIINGEPTAVSAGEKCLAVFPGEDNLKHATPLCLRRRLNPVTTLIPCAGMSDFRIFSCSARS